MLRCLLSVFWTFMTVNSEIENTRSPEKSELLFHCYDLQLESRRILRASI